MKPVVDVKSKASCSKNWQKKHMDISNSQIVFFDGVCNLCNGIVNTLLDLDKRHVLLFASLQGDTYRQISRGYSHLSSEREFSTILFYSSGRWYERSEAVIRIMISLGGLWKTALVLLWIPRIIRDGIYSWVANHRYAWFGVRDVCRIPTPDVVGRLLP